MGKTIKQEFQFKRKYFGLGNLSRTQASIKMLLSSVPLTQGERTELKRALKQIEYVLQHFKDEERVQIAFDLYTSK